MRNFFYILATLFSLLVVSWIFVSLTLVSNVKNTSDKVWLVGEATAFKSKDKNIVERWMFVNVNGTDWAVQPFGYAEFRCNPGDKYTITQYDIDEANIVYEVPVSKFSIYIDGVVPDKPGVVKSKPGQPTLKFVPYVYAPP